ncbi:MAG: hypothetical protein ACI9G1_005526 [Pirellulaceae bacterium]|jgi:hypothetical protein
MFNVDRRSFTKGMALGSGGLALAPLLQQMQVHADGDESQLPKRFVFVVKSSGLTAEAIRPLDAELGDGSSLVDLDLNDYTLAETLQPLEQLKNQVTIIDGLSGANFTGNHSAYYGALSCHHGPEKPAAETIDCMLGRLNPAPFSIYGFAPNGHSIGNNFGPQVQETAVFPKISAFGPNKPMAFQASAEKAYRQLFGSAIDLATGGKKEFALQANLLDFLAEDVKRVQRNVSQAEREKLEQYLDAFESVRGRNTQLAEMREIISRNAPELTSQYSSKVFVDRVRVFFELTAAALITGLTNVITIRADWLSTKYSSFGFGSTSVHDIGHNKATANGLKTPEARSVIRKFHVEEIAKLANRLKSVPEGNGTMLDNTMIIYLSDMADAHHSSRRNWPFVLVGGANHKLNTGGRYLRYPSYHQAGHKTIGNLYNTILQSNGVPPQDYFGQLDSQLQDLDLKGPLAELLG